MAIYDDKWFEVRYSDGVDVAPTYLLIVTPNPKDTGRILIMDPFMRNEIVFEATDYEAAHSWLCEDEYSLANGGSFLTMDGESGIALRVTPALIRPRDQTKACS
jgi:hypothetical protein